MLHACHHLFLGSGRARQFVGNDHSRHLLQPFEELAEELFGRTLVSPTLDQKSKHSAILVNCSPQGVGLSIDA